MDFFIHPLNSLPILGSRIKLYLDSGKTIVSQQLFEMEGLCEECSRLMLDGGQTVNNRDDRGHTPLITAVLNEHVMCIETLLNKHGADPYITDKYDTTVMEFAAGCENEKGLELLIKAGVSVNMTKSSYNQDPLMQAAIGSKHRSV